jgi:hypothetical protein
MLEENQNNSKLRIYIRVCNRFAKGCVVIYFPLLVTYKKLLRNVSKIKFENHRTLFTSLNGLVVQNDCSTLQGYVGVM